jgi:pyrimidine oxygenase
MDTTTVVLPGQRVHVDRLGYILIAHPTLMAKMSATIQDVSAGRLGLNIFTGSTLGESVQMGILPDGYDQKRYALASEWIQVLKRLGAELA